MLKGFSIIAAIAMLMLARDVHAQSITVDDPTGGVTPEAVYCPSTGGCFTSWKAAEDALRAATPDVGHLLLLAPGDTVYSSIIYKYFRVPEGGLATNGDASLLTGITNEDGRRYGSFGYDIHGRVLLSTLTLMVDGSGSTQYCHDRFGQVVRKVQTSSGVALTLRYAYTKSGQLQAMTYL